MGISTSVDTAKKYPKAVIPVYTSTRIVWEYKLFHILLTFNFFSNFNASQI